jgi:hypothetical protein
LEYERQEQRNRPKLGSAGRIPNIYWHVRGDTNWAALFNALIKAAGDLSKLINLDGPDTDAPR